MERTCKTCRWVADAKLNDGGVAKCDAPQNLVPTGFTSDRRNTYCESHRSDGWFRARKRDTCGREGRWWAEAAQ